MNVSWHLIICQKERMGWDGMGRWRVWVSSSTIFYFFIFLFFLGVWGVGFKITTPIHTFKLIIPYLNISGRLYSPTFLTSP
jgi:hypothetical protein